MHFCHTDISIYRLIFIPLQPVMELQLYNLSLLIVGVLNLAMTIGLLINNQSYRQYPIYRRSRVFTALFFAVFGIGMLLHYHFEWRMSYPLLATALSVSYFHIAGVAITWSHTSLLNPRYLSTRVVARDVAFLLVGIPAYWISATQSSLYTLNCWLLVFLAHCVWMSFDFYITYFRVSHRLMAMRQGSIEGFIRWMLLSCHFIIAFGIGSIMLTSLFPIAVWPYTVLLCVSGFVFVYIFYSICEYGSVIDPLTNATKDTSNEFS